PEQTKNDQAESAPAGLETFYAQDIAWETCDDNGDFDCGTVDVPMDYENPDDQSIEIRVMRATETATEQPMLFNPGGPGSSGISFVQDSLSSMLSKNLLDNISAIGFDPRGVGASEPIQCETDEEFDESRQTVFDPSTPEGWQQSIEENKAYGQQCL